MTDENYGRSLIENLYGTLIGLVWPFLYLNADTYQKLFHNLDLSALSAVTFAYLFICDDYYTCHKCKISPDRDHLISNVRDHAISWKRDHPISRERDHLITRCS